MKFKRFAGLTAAAAMVVAGVAVGGTSLLRAKVDQVLRAVDETGLCHAGSDATFRLVRHLGAGKYLIVTAVEEGHMFRTTRVSFDEEGRTRISREKRFEVSRREYDRITREVSAEFDRAIAPAEDGTLVVVELRDRGRCVWKTMRESESTNQGVWRD